MAAAHLGSLADGALNEVRAVFTALTSEAAETLVSEIQGGRRIALYGVGREGLMMKAFAMRLYHLGLDAYVVGDMTTPPLGPGDLLIVSAGPGQFSTVLALMGVARADGARTVVVTAQPGGAAAAAATSPPRRWPTTSALSPRCCRWAACTRRPNSSSSSSS
jgi:6-phospho-3-hexuloisomerase